MASQQYTIVLCRINAVMYNVFFDLSFSTVVSIEKGEMLGRIPCLSLPSKTVLALDSSCLVWFIYNTVFSISHA